MDLKLYVRQVAVLLTGATAAQAINLASYPILARLYSPHEFGVFALFMTITGIIGPIAAGRLDLVVQSTKDFELGAAIRLSHLINTGVSMLTALGVALYAAGDPDIGLIHAVLAGTAVFLTGFTLSATAFLVRHERYKMSAQSVVVRTLLTALGQILLYFIYPGALALMIGFVLGFAAQAWMLRAVLRGYRLRQATSRKLRAVATRYRHQLTVDIPGTLLGALVLNILSFFLLALYSTEEVGYYSLAFRVAVLPLVLVAASLSEVFFQKAALSYRQTGTFWRPLRFNLLASAVISTAVFIPMAAVARPLFGFVFGPEWLPAADVLIYLVPMLAVRFISASVQTAPLVVGRPQWLFVQNVALLAAMGSAFLLASRLSLDLRSYLLLNSLLMAAVYGGFVLFVAVLVHHRYRISSKAS